MAAPIETSIVGPYKVERIVVKDGQLTYHRTRITTGGKSAIFNTVRRMEDHDVDMYWHRNKPVSPK